MLYDGLLNVAFALCSLFVRSLFFSIQRLQSLFVHTDAVLIPCILSSLVLKFNSFLFKASESLSNCKAKHETYVFLLSIDIVQHPGVLMGKALGQCEFD